MPDATNEPADPEDAKLARLARSAQTRTGAAEGAAVRDHMGRTYLAATVVLPSLALSALQAAVAAAVSSGADQLEAAAVCSYADGLAPADVSLLTDVGATTVLLVDRDGGVREQRTLTP